MSLESAIDRLAAAIEALAASNGAAVPAAPKAEKPAKPAAAKAAPKAAPAAPAVPATPAAPAATAATGIDKKTLTQKFVDLAKAKGRQVAAEILAKYGAADLPGLLAQADKYDDAAAAIDSALAS